MRCIAITVVVEWKGRYRSHHCVGMEGVYRSHQCDGLEGAPFLSGQ